MPFPPQAFLIGAQKAGTTTLASLLDQHDNICLSDPKEPHYISKHYERGSEWYAAQFPDTGAKILIDASTTYAMAAPGADADMIAQRIAETSPKARIIYSVRDPADRTYSAYWHSVRSGSETKPFRDAVAANPQYIQTGRYYFQIGQYLKHFTKEQIHIVDFRALSADPIAVARECLAFLGCAPEAVDFSESRARNQTYQYSSLGRAVRRIAGTHQRMTGLARMVQTATPSFLHGPIKRMVASDIPALDAQDRAWLDQQFADDLAALKDFCGIDLRA